MARDLKRSRALRQLAERIVAEIPEPFLTSTRPDLATSLVRQWQTYDDEATLLLGEEQHYFKPAPGPGKELIFGIMRIPLGPWLRKCMKDWDLEENDVGEAVRQLNLGQSAHIESRRGDFLRLWVNPKEKSKGLERLGPKRAGPAPARRGISPQSARRQLESILGADVDAVTLEEFVASLVRQWAAFGGHGLILTQKAKYHLTVVPQPDGMTKVTTEPKKTTLPDKLRSCGSAPAEIAAILHDLNVGRTPEITDEQGRRCRIGTDPRRADVFFDIIAPPPAGASFVSGW